MTRIVNFVKRMFSYKDNDLKIELKWEEIEYEKSNY